MDTLTKLAIKHGTDRWGKHHYTPVYYQLFRNKGRRRAVRKVVEVGVGEGAGLRMWRDFFTNAFIHGADNQEDRLFREERIEVIHCDQSKRDDLVELITWTGFDVDLFVDDGSHKPEHQLYTCAQVMPLLHKGAIYVIEDVAEPNVAKGLTRFSPEVVECGKRYDDRLIIIRK